MKHLKTAAVLLLLTFLGAFFMQNSNASEFKITSTSFVNGQTLPKGQIHSHFGCTGENTSPDLKWEGAPEGTKSFALIVHDPDAPRPTGWYHWIVLNIPADVTGLKKGQFKPLKPRQIKELRSYLDKIVNIEEDKEENNA